MIHNILLCDADRRLLAFHEGLLRHAGYYLATAQDMNTLSTQLWSAAFSLVIAELTFPECAASDPVSVIRHVRTLRQGIPILALTSNADPAAHREARALGVWDICLKPARCTELLGLIRNILEGIHAENYGCVASRGTGSDRSLS